MLCPGALSTYNKTAAGDSLLYEEITQVSFYLLPLFFGGDSKNTKSSVTFFFYSIYVFPFNFNFFNNIKPNQSSHPCENRNPSFAISGKKQANSLALLSKMSSFMLILFDSN